MSSEKKPLIYAVFFLTVNSKCLIIARLSVELGENEKLFEDFPSIGNSAVFLCKLFWKEEKMRKVRVLIVIVCVMAIANTASADTFGTGDNQFTIDFVPISGSTNPTSGIPAGGGFTFTGVNNDYRMGKFEITNDQWNKFKTNLGVPVTGYPSTAYDSSSYYTGANVPTNNVS
jgi:hypothetical protein